MRWFGWFRKPESYDQATAELGLKPGTCECEHSRCFHLNGTGGCTVAFPADQEWPEGAVCACEIFILDEDSGGGDDTSDTPTDPAIKELERMLNK